jgi:hypothetical protein
MDGGAHIPQPRLGRTYSHAARRAFSAWRSVVPNRRNHTVRPESIGVQFGWSFSGRRVAPAGVGSSRTRSSTPLAPRLAPLSRVRLEHLFVTGMIFRAFHPWQVVGGRRLAWPNAQKRVIARGQ